MKNRILAHRGLHHETNFEKNSFEALKLAIDEGFGIETDLRIHRGELIISHDSVDLEEYLPFSKLLGLDEKLLTCGIFALNIKEDGLCSSILGSLNAFGNKIDYFVFDMSIPDSLAFYSEGMSVYARFSEFELPSPQMISQSSGFWIDNFSGDFPQLYWAQHVLSMKKEFCLVSPELHGRDHRSLWRGIVEKNLHRYKGFRICTDYPRQASSYFHL